MAKVKNNHRLQTERLTAIPSFDYHNLHFCDHVYRRLWLFSQIRVLQNHRCFLNLFISNAGLLVIAVGQTIVMITGGIDISVGSITALVVWLWPIRWRITA